METNMRYFYLILIFLSYTIILDIIQKKALGNIWTLSLDYVVGNEITVIKSFLVYMGFTKK